MHTHLESFVAQQVQLQHLLVEINAELNGVAVLTARPYEQLVLCLGILVESAKSSSSSAILLYILCPARGNR